MIFRDATRADLPTILALLADDPLGARRETGVVDARHEKAFADISADPRNRLIVLDDDGEVIGCAQLTFIPGISRQGAERALIEAVRIRADRRGGGLGRRLFGWLIETSREHGCALVQLTTDKSRTDAQRFYTDLGFVASHEGMKLTLPTAPGA